MELVTPLHFSVVQPNLYRGSYPKHINYDFLETLCLKTIVSLSPTSPIETDEGLQQFIESHNIKLHHVKVSDSKKDKKTKRKKKAVPIEYESVEQCVRVIVDKKNYPIYMHGVTDNDLSISLIVACLRKFSYWSNISILNEFLTYTSSINIHERTFIENFSSEIVIDDVPLFDKVPWISTTASVNSMLPKLKFIEI